VLPENFIGYINEVRIWNIARTQSEIKTYMNQSLPNPQTTPGLLAYYTFDNLLNKQGNTAWNGTVGGSAAINKANPNCAFVPDSCGILSTLVQASFTAPDTVCVNSPVTITNTSVSASSYFWNFCVADVDGVPSATNIGNPGSLSMPVFIDYAYSNGNYYGFIINYNPGRLIRLDFGNSLLNNPVSIDLGNFGNIIPTGAEAIQIVQNEGRWYAIIVGGSPAAGSAPRIVKIDFGASLSNTAPLATNWGNIGNMLQPIDLHVFKEGNNWYGFTVNSENNTITRFSFTNSFNSTPTAVNLGNIGNLQYPTGIHAINDNGFWRVFIVNGGDNTRASNACSLTRLDFGSSLLNTPSGVNLGNPGNVLQHPRDLTIIKLCDQIIGFAVNGNPNYNDLVKINFNNSLALPPTISSLGNSSNFNFPHSISKLFRVNNDVYGFVTNVANNTISRIKFDGCTNSSQSNSILQYPVPVIYNAPGTYNINLSVDDGLPTQATFCKQVVVLPELVKKSVQNISVCAGEIIKIGTSINFAKYTWNTGETTDSIIVKSPGTYWVEIKSYGCSMRDSFIITEKSPSIVKIYNSDTTIYAGDIVQLNSFSSTGYYSWLPRNNLNCYDCRYPIASPTSSTTFLINNLDECEQRIDSVHINVVQRTTSICGGFQKSFGTTEYDYAFDVAPSFGDEFFTIGSTKSSGNDDILISKMNLNGTVTWSKRIGASNTESVRKASATSDGGLLITGQTKSFGNLNGDILALKLDIAGNIQWSKKFGVGSVWGDIGMDIIETSDGGSVISGILNVRGGVADAFVMKLDKAANVTWSKRFDHLDGDDGVGIVQQGDTLLVAIDLQNSMGNYTLTVMKLKLDDGSFIMAKKLLPGARGLFNPYLYKNPAQPGYIISGHTIDGASYSNMKHTILVINDNLDIVDTKLITVSPVTNDFFTGIVPLSDGSFLGVASPQTNSDGYLYRVRSNNTVAFAKKFNDKYDRKLYRLAAMGEYVIAVGGTTKNDQEDFFVTVLDKDGTLGPDCNVENVSIGIEEPVYTVEPFLWPSMTNVSFTSSFASLSTNAISLEEVDLCPKSAIDFSYLQNPCTPKTIQFTSNLSGISSYQWLFGDGKTNSSSQTPVNNYNNYGIYTVKLLAQYSSGCAESITKTITIGEKFDDGLILNRDTTICLGDSILLNTKDDILERCLRTSAGDDLPTFTYVKPDTNTTYILKTQVLGNNLVGNGDFNNGNTGFSSEYSSSNSGLPAAVYSVGSNIVAWNPSLASCHDHTTGTSAMMMVHGGDKPNVSVWSQTVAVQPNTNYVFYAWLQNIGTVNPARLQFAINGNHLGSAFNANPQSCIWQRFYCFWNSGNTTSARLSFMNMNQDFPGNDFALDDIFFGTTTTKTDSLTVTVGGLCDSVKISGPDKVCNKTDVLTYSVFKSFNCNQSYILQVDNEFADIVSRTDTSFSLRFKQDGITKVKVGLTNNCKILMDSIPVTVKLSPTIIDLGNDVLTCRDTIIDLNAGIGFDSYLWQDGTNAPVYSVTIAGRYFVTAQNFCGASFNDTFNLVKTSPLPFQVLPSNAAVCSGDSLQLYASGGDFYSWQPANYFNNSHIASPKAIINKSMDLSVQISDFACGRDTIIYLPVKAKEKAEITIRKQGDVNCRIDSTILFASGGVLYNWSPNLYIYNTSGNQIIIKPPQTTTYYLQGIGASGCIGQDSVTVFFVKEGEQKLFIPNAFTPNNDGLNDVFKPVFTGPAVKYDFKIFNRWGELVFQTNTPGKGWNGIFRSIPQPKEVYIYYITAEGGCNGKFEQKGTFVLIK
jgi:gliding motility-associated-like protein